MVMKIYVKKIEGLILPKKGSPVSAGYDIISTSDPKIVGDKAGFGWNSVDYIEYETNLYIAPSAVTFHTLIHPRSSVSKYNLVLANSIGLIDNDYRGMVICRFKYIWQPEDFKWIHTEENDVSRGIVNLNKIYKKGDTIAQLVIEPTIQADWEIVDDLGHTQRGEGGFGSTDSKQTLGLNPDSVPKVLPKPDPSRLSLSEIYNKFGGVSVKEKYTEEVRKRESADV